MIRATLEWIWLAILAAALLLLPYSYSERSTLQAVKDSGKLVVLTFNGPTTYYEGPDGGAGFEHDLAQQFADTLGVELEIVVEDSFDNILPQIASGKAHFAASGITITDARKEIVRFSHPYQEIRQQVVFRRGNPRPRKISDLVGRDIGVVAGSSYVERLTDLKQVYPDLEWTEIPGMTPEELLIEVWEGLLENTIADSNIVAVVRQHYPEIHFGFDIQGSEPLAWAFPISNDDSLYLAANQFLQEMENSGGLAQLRDRYYGPAGRANYVDVTTFQRRIDNILPLYQETFEAAAEENEIDWRLLAAVAYQESYWDAEAVSPTGVRGIMMLTKATAKRLKIADRTDPQASIEGGARYLRTLRKKMPTRIEEPDRTWMALAAYNVGYGHLEDARILTEAQGGDPDKWLDVREHLPLLANPKWYRRTKHGYARGYEPVKYVSRIRSFFDILTRISEEQAAEEVVETPELEVPAL